MSASPQLSTLAGSAMSGTRRNITTLWAALAKQVPAIRNATHYYAYDVQRISRELYEQANSLRKDSSELRAEPENPPTHEAEAHYSPLSASDLGVSVKRVSLFTTRDGFCLLALCIEGGFALFDVTVDGVTEISVELQHRDSTVVVDALPVTRTRAIIVFSDALAFYDATTRTMSPKHALPDVASSAYLLRSTVAVVSAEYSQIALFGFSESSQIFSEERHIIADRGVIATSHRWLAFCGESSTSTDVRANVVESATSAVTKSLKDGIVKVGGLLAAASGVNAATDKLGAVTITDVETGRDVATFLAHNHNLQIMRFDASGTLLATASVSGTNVNIWHITPSSRGGKHVGAVSLLARLSRGYTTGTITSIDFSPLNTWVSVSTSVGTCHVFELPTAVSSRIGTQDSTLAAPTITASCRCRSAPMASPVNPVVTFMPWLHQRPLRAVLVVATSAATVAAFELAEGGVKRIFTQHLTEFTLAVDEPSDEISEPHQAAAPVEQLQADFVWRSQIELKTHPISAKLRNLRVLDHVEVQRSTFREESAAEVANVDEDWNEA